MKHAITILSIVSVIVLVIIGQSQSPDASQDAVELIDRVALKKHAPDYNPPSDTIETNAAVPSDELESSLSAGFKNTALGESFDNADLQQHSVDEYRVERTGGLSIKDWVEELAERNVIAEKTHKNAADGKINSVTADEDEASGARVMHVEITGYETITTVGNVVTRSVNTNYDAGAEQVTGINNYPQADNQLAPVNEAQSYDVVDEVTYNSNGEQEKYELPCPKSLYGGGNEYSISMLKKRGCPKPEFYTGPW